jgi:hypothetical protein
MPHRPFFAKVDRPTQQRRRRRSRIVGCLPMGGSSAQIAPIRFNSAWGGRSFSIDVQGPGGAALRIPTRRLVAILPFGHSCSSNQRMRGSPREPENLGQRLSHEGGIGMTKSRTIRSASLGLCAILVGSSAFADVVIPYNDYSGSPTIARGHGTSADPKPR